MLDECVGHMTEKVVIPEADQIDDHAAPLYRHSRPKNFCLFEPNEDLVPDMAARRRWLQRSTSPA